MLSSLQVFRAGRHVSSDGRAIEFTAADVDASARAYDPAIHEAPIVVGHPRDNEPAYGWVQSLAAHDGALEATPHQVEPQFAALVEQGRYKKISASFYTPESSSNPVPGIWYLRHVGFLGAQPPAVKGLRAPSFGEGEEGVVAFSEYISAGLWRRLREWLIAKFGLEVADQVAPGFEIEALESSARSELAAVPSPAGFAEEDTSMAEMGKGEAGKGTGPSVRKAIRDLQDAGMTLVDISAALEKMGEDASRAPSILSAILNEEIKNPPDSLLQFLRRIKPPKETDMAERVELDRREQELAERERRIAASEAATQRKSVEEFVETLVTGGRVLPRDRAGLVAYMAALPSHTGGGVGGEGAVIEFAEEGAQKKVPAADWLREFLARLPQQVDFAERAGAEAQPAAVDFAAPPGYSIDSGALELHRKVKVHQAAHPGTSYDAALASVTAG